MKFKIGEIVHYSAMPRLSGKIVDIHGNIYVVRWEPENNGGYISYHDEEQLQ